MCEMMGSEPIEEEIPVTRADLYYETREVFTLYDILPAKWEGMSGTYMGKELLLLPILFEEHNTEPYIKKYAWHIIPLIDSIVAEDIAEKVKRKSKGIPSGSH